MLVGCAPEPVAELPPVPTRMLPLPRAGTPGPVVLYPRHRVLSGVPPVMVLAVADTGPVVVTLETDSGRRRTWHSRARTLSWPAGWAPLSVGERGRVTVLSCGRADSAEFERAPPLRPDLRWRSAPQGASWLLQAGLPMEALRLLAADPRGSAAEWTQALSSAGVPTMGLWLGR